MKPRIGVYLSQDVAARLAVAAVEADDLAAVAVELEDLSRPGQPVETIDVLGHHGDQVAAALQLDQRLVGRVGPGGGCRRSSGRWP